MAIPMNHSLFRILGVAGLIVQHGPITAQHIYEGKTNRKQRC